MGATLQRDELARKAALVRAAGFAGPAIVLDSEYDGEDTDAPLRVAPWGVVAPKWLLPPEPRRPVGPRLVL